MKMGSSQLGALRVEKRICHHGREPGDREGTGGPELARGRAHPHPHPHPATSGEKNFCPGAQGWGRERPHHGLGVRKWPAGLVKGTLRVREGGGWRG